jgi:hypothetical protein
MSDQSMYLLGPFLEAMRVTKGLARPGDLARRMRPAGSQDSISKLGNKVRRLEKEGVGSRSLFDRMVAALEIPPDEVEQQVAEQLRVWKADEIPGNPRLEILRGVSEHREPLRRLHPWVPFPQNGTCFAFGQRKLPLPVGALFVLWEQSPEFVSPCPHCQTGTALGYCFGGLFAIGGINQDCLDCGKESTNRYGGFVRLQQLVEPLLADTPFYVSGKRFGAAYSGERTPIVNALRGLGWEVEVPERWLAQEEPARLGLGLRGKFSSGFFLGT